MRTRATRARSLPRGRPRAPAARRVAPSRRGRLKRASFTHSFFRATLRDLRVFGRKQRLDESRVEFDRLLQFAPRDALAVRVRVEYRAGADEQRRAPTL